MQIITHEVDEIVTEGLSSGIIIDDEGLEQEHASCTRLQAHSIP